MGFIFGSGTGETQESVTDARKRLAAAMLQQGTNTGPIQSPWEGAARMAQALMGGLAIRKQGEAEQAGMAEGMAALTGQPYTPPEKPAGFLSSIFGGNKAADPGATGSSMPKVDASGNIPVTPSSGGLPGSFLAAVDRTEGAGGYDTLYGNAQKNGPFAGTDITRMPIRDVIAFTDPSGPYAQSVKSQIGRVATPVGRYQVVGTTLRNAVGALGLDPNAPFDQNAQDAVGAYLARQRIASADSLPGQMAALRQEWHGFKNVPDEQLAQVVADLRSSNGATPPVNVASANPPAGMPSAPPIQPPPVNPPAPAPTPGYTDPMVAPNAAPPMPQAAAPGEVASLDPSIGIPMPGAAGQMRASAPAQPMPPQAGPQAALSPLPSSTVGPTPNVASLPPVGQQIPPEFQNSPQLVNADPNSGIMPALLGGSPASPEQVAQAQQSGQARLAQALDGASPPQASNPMANPRAQALAKVLMNPNTPAPMKQMAAQSLQTLMKPPEYGFQTLPDGTVLRSDPRSGTLTPVYRSEMSQADQQRLKIDQEKLNIERNKPTEVNGRLIGPDGKVIADFGNGDWDKLENGSLFNKKTGEVRSAQSAGGPAGFRFNGNSVEAQSLNGLIDSKAITPEQAQQLGAGKTITGPNGEIIFMTPQGVFGSPAGGGTPQPLNAPQASQGAPIDLFGDGGGAAPAGAAPVAPPAPVDVPPVATPPAGPSAAPTPVPVSPVAQPVQAPAGAPPAPAGAAPAQRPGMIPLTQGKPDKPLTEAQQKNRSLYSVIKPELKTVEDSFDALTDPKNQVGSKIPFSEFVTTPEYQKAANSLQTIITSYLYSVSGATATPEEVKKQTDILTPRPGEDKASIDNKKRRIRTMVNAVAQSGGLPGEEAPAAPRPRATNPQTGETVEFDGTQWVPVK